MKRKALWIKTQWLSLLTLGILPLMLGCVTLDGVAHSTGWKAPPIEMQDCIQLGRAIGPNPFSRDPNDLALVTTYEEMESPAADKKTLLMVNGILLDEVRHQQIVYFSALVLKISHREHDLSKVSSWILADTKADGIIDKALFQEKVVTDSGDESTVSEVEGTKGEIANLQIYYQKAVRMMNAKARSKPPESCPTEDAEGESI